MVSSTSTRSLFTAPSHPFLFFFPTQPSNKSAISSSKRKKKLELMSSDFWMVLLSGRHQTTSSALTRAGTKKKAQPHCTHVVSMFAGPFATPSPTSGIPASPGREHTAVSVDAASSVFDAAQRSVDIALLQHRSPSTATSGSADDFSDRSQFSAPGSAPSGSAFAAPPSPLAAQTQRSSDPSRSIELRYRLMCEALGAKVSPAVLRCCVSHDTLALSGYVAPLPPSTQIPGTAAFRAVLDPTCAKVASSSPPSTLVPDSSSGAVPEDLSVREVDALWQSVASDEQRLWANAEVYEEINRIEEEAAMMKRRSSLPAGSGVGGSAPTTKLPTTSDCAAVGENTGVATQDGHGIPKALMSPADAAAQYPNRDSAGAHIPPSALTTAAGAVPPHALVRAMSNSTDGGDTDLGISSVVSPTAIRGRSAPISPRDGDGNNTAGHQASLSLASALVARLTSDAQTDPPHLRLVGGGESPGRDRNDIPLSTRAAGRQSVTFRDSVSDGAATGSVDDSTGQDCDAHNAAATTPRSRAAWAHRAGTTGATSTPPLGRMWIPSRSTSLVAVGGLQVATNGSMSTQPQSSSAESTSLRTKQRRPGAAATNHSALPPGTFPSCSVVVNSLSAFEEPLPAPLSVILSPSTQHHGLPGSGGVGPGRADGRSVISGQEAQHVIRASARTPRSPTSPRRRFSASVDQLRVVSTDIEDARQNEIVSPRALQFVSATGTNDPNGTHDSTGRSPSSPRSGTSDRNQNGTERHSSAQAGHSESPPQQAKDMSGPRSDMDESPAARSDSELDQTARPSARLGFTDIRDAGPSADLPFAETPTVLSHQSGGVSPSGPVRAPSSTNTYPLVSFNQVVDASSTSMPVNGSVAPAAGGESVMMPLVPTPPVGAATPPLPSRSSLRRPSASTAVIARSAATPAVTASGGRLLTPTGAPPAEDSLRRFAADGIVPLFPFARTTNPAIEASVQDHRPPSRSSPLAFFGASQNGGGFESPLENPLGGLDDRSAMGGEQRSTRPPVHSSPVENYHEAGIGRNRRLSLSLGVGSPLASPPAQRLDSGPVSDHEPAPFSSLDASPSFGRTPPRANPFPARGGAVPHPPSPGHGGAATSHRQDQLRDPNIGSPTSGIRSVPVSPGRSSVGPRVEFGARSTGTVTLGGSTHGRVTRASFQTTVPDGSSPSPSAPALDVDGTRSALRSFRGAVDEILNETAAGIRPKPTMTSHAQIKSRCSHSLRSNAQASSGGAPNGVLTRADQTSRREPVNLLHELDDAVANAGSLDLSVEVLGGGGVFALISVLPALSLLRSLNLDSLRMTSPHGTALASALVKLCGPAATSDPVLRACRSTRLEKLPIPKSSNPKSEFVSPGRQLLPTAPINEKGSGRTSRSFRTALKQARAGDLLKMEPATQTSPARAATAVGSATEVGTTVSESAHRESEETPASPERVTTTAHRPEFEPSSLLSLDVRRDAYRSVAALELQHRLSFRGRLTALSLRGNPDIGLTAAKEIAAAVHQCRTLLAVDLSGLPLPGKDVARLERAVAGRSKALHMIV